MDGGILRKGGKKCRIEKWTECDKGCQWETRKRREEREGGEKRGKREGEKGGRGDERGWKEGRDFYP